MTSSKAACGKSYRNPWEGPLSFIRNQRASENSTLLDLLDKEKKIIDSGKAEKIAQKLKNNFNITLTGPIPKTERSN